MCHDGAGKLTAGQAARPAAPSRRAFGLLVAGAGLAAVAACTPGAAPPPSAPPLSGSQPTAQPPANQPGPPAGGDPPPVGAPAGPPPPSHLAMSIVACLLSVGVFGGVAIYFSSRVGRRWAAGDLAGARRASARARVWGIVGLVVGGLFWLSQFVH
jgi:hypothetical protein